MTGQQFLGWVLIPLLLIALASLLVGPWLYYALYVPLFVGSVAMMSWRYGKP